MCTTTHDQNKGKTGKEQTMKPQDPAAPLPLTPFAATPYPKPDETSHDQPLEDALNAAINMQRAKLGGANGKVAWSIFCFNANGGYRYAGVDHNLIHYSASLLKVAAMYSAHELLAAANRLARLPGPHTATPSAFFAELQTRFDKQITDVALANTITAMTQLVAKMQPAKQYRVTPSYDLIFDASGVGGPANPPPIKFNADFLDNMTNMIEWSGDDEAGECIRRLSYPYINAALMKAGFYDPPPANDGIWLAGDYTATTLKNPRATQMSVNDQLIAQGTTTRKMARVFALIKKGLLVTQDNNNDSMRNLLALAASHGGFFRLYNPVNPKPFDLILSKIGVGPLKAGPDVMSEGHLLRWKTAVPAAKNLEPDFVVVWQNLREDLGGTVGGIVETLRSTMTPLMT